MNPLNTSNGLPPQIVQNIQQVKRIMQMGDLRQNPQMQQVMQMCRGQNPKLVFENMCRQMGINPNDIINAIKG
jgi:hypothetical protein